MEAPSLPIPLPASPPSTPDSLGSPRKSAGTPYVSPYRGGQKPSHEFTPPEHIDPRHGHKFSYRPGSSGSFSTDSDDDASGEANDEGGSGSEASSRSDHVKPRVSVRSVDEDRDFSVEDVTESDSSYDTCEVLRPCEFEDAASDKGVPSELVDEFRKFTCSESDGEYDGGEEEDGDEDGDGNEDEDEGLSIRQRRHARKLERWRRGGNKKRNHQQSVGSGSDDNDDCLEVEDHDAGYSASCLDRNRRTRRKTGEPISRPRHSLIFDDPPKEIEELMLAGGDGYQPLVSDSEEDDSGEDSKENGMVKLCFEDDDDDDDDDDGGSDDDDDSDEEL